MSLCAAPAGQAEAHHCFHREGPGDILGPFCSIQVLLLSMAFPELILFFEYKWKIEKFLASLGSIKG